MTHAKRSTRRSLWNLQSLAWNIKRWIALLSNIICFTRASGHAHSQSGDLSTTHIVLFISPRDLKQIDVSGRQLNNTEFIRDCYKKATNEPFGHFMIDFDPRTSDSALLLQHCGTGANWLWHSTVISERNTSYEWTGKTCIYWSIAGKTRKANLCEKFCKAAVTTQSSFCASALLTLLKETFNSQLKICSPSKRNWKFCVIIQSTDRSDDKFFLQQREFN